MHIGGYGAVNAEVKATATGNAGRITLGPGEVSIADGVASVTDVVLPGEIDIVSGYTAGNVEATAFGKGAEVIVQTGELFIGGYGAGMTVGSAGAGNGGKPADAPRW